MPMLVLLFYLFGPTLADYDCICTYQVETNIYDKPDLNSNVIGYMYEFDCKPTYALAWIDPKFKPIGNEHMLGFIEVGSENSVQVCQGSISNLDKVPPEYLTPPPTTTTTTVTTSTQQTTTTTTPPPTTPTPTPLPTTTTTTPPPTTPTPTPLPTTTTTTPLPTASTTSTKPTTTIKLSTATTKPTTITTTQTSTAKRTTFKTTNMPSTPTQKTTMITTKTTTTSPTTVPSTKQTTVPSTQTHTTSLRTTHAHTIVTVPVNTVQGPNNLCPSNVKQYTQLDNLYVHNQFCYEFVNQRNSFFHAEFDCPKRGGTMVYIRDDSDQDFLYRMMKDLKHYSPVWLGLHDVNTEGAWEWVSDYPLNYTNWMLSSFHDSAHNAEDCGVFVAARHNGQWDDVHCNGILFSTPAEYPWICQYNITATG